MALFAPFMNLALAEARAAAVRGETPVGAVVVGADRRILACDGNRTREFHDPTAHAEIIVLRSACSILRSERLIGCTIYVTLEPCAMCAAAISAAQIARLVYGAADAKSGGIEQGARIFSHPQTHHKPEVVAGVAESAAAALLRDFFVSRR